MLCHPDEIAGRPDLPFLGGCMILNRSMSEQASIRPFLLFNGTVIGSKRNLSPVSNGFLEGLYIPLKRFND